MSESKKMKYKILEVIPFCPLNGESYVCICNISSLLAHAYIYFV